MPILRAITYVINTLQDKNIVWGVGRGSSVSSYVLYILGVHDVDSVKYNLDIADFLRAPEEK
jgi:DNA polymerase III alpha subunit